MKTFQTQFQIPKKTLCNGILNSQKYIFSIRVDMTKGRNKDYIYIYLYCVRRKLSLSDFLRANFRNFFPLPGSKK